MFNKREVHTVYSSCHCVVVHVHRRKHYANSDVIMLTNTPRTVMIIKCTLHRKTKTIKGKETEGILPTTKEVQTHLNIKYVLEKI